MLRQRIPLLIGLSLVSVIGGLYAVSSMILLRSFAQLEQQAMQRNVEQAVDRLSSSLTELSSVAADYARWDDTYAFIEDQNGDFVRLNLDEPTFNTFNLDVIILVDRSNQIVFGRQFDRAQATVTPLPASLRAHLTGSSLLLQHAHPTSSQAGFLVLPEGLLMIASRPILTGEGEGPIRGSLLMGRYLDADEIQRLAVQVHSSIGVYPLDANPGDANSPDRSEQAAFFLPEAVRSQLLETDAILAQPLNAGEIAGYQLLSDLYGQPNLVLQINAPRTVYQQGLLSLQYLGASLLVVGLLAGIIIRQLLRQLVQHVTERDRMEQELLQEAALRRSEAQYREKAEALEQAITELKQAQLQLVQSEKMSSLGQLVAGIAHEINNPVNFISGNLVFAEQYVQDLLMLLRLYQQHCPTLPDHLKAQMAAIDANFLFEDLPKLLLSMQVGSDRIQQIVLSLRNFSRTDQTELKSVDIHEGIDSTLLLLQGQLKAKSGHPGIEVIKEYGGLPLVECYVGQLNQVLMNLLANAIDAIDEKLERPETLEPGFRPWIRIRTELVDKQAAIHIADNGAGMTETVRQRLFDPFFTTKAIGKGTGLGLAISYRIIVDRHQGQLRCHSTPGQGAEFTVHIPLQQPMRALLPQPQLEPDDIYCSSTGANGSA